MTIEIENLLEQDALFRPSLSKLKGGPGSSIEDLPNFLLAPGGALVVGKGVDLLSHGASLLKLHRLLLNFSEFLDGVWVVAEVLLLADEDDGDVGAELLHLWRPLLWDVLQRVR